jgi:hypothetical protein
MSLLFSDGFEWLPAGTVTTTTTGTKYNTVTGSCSRISPRIAGWGIYMSSGELIKRFDTQSKVYVGCAFQPRFTSTKMISLKNPSGTEQCYLICTADQRLSLVGGATVTFENVYLKTNTWSYVELMVDFNGSASSNSYELRMDGAFVGSGYADLSATATPNCGGVGIIGHNFDDLYVTNASGGASDNFREFLGPISIRTLFPMGSGLQTDYLNEKGLVSSNNWASTSGAYDGDTSFVEGSGNNRSDLYQMQNMPEISTIKGVSISTVGRFVDSPYGYYNHALSTSNGSSEYFPGSGNIGSSYGTTSHPISKSFITSNDWSVAEINDLQIGTKVVVD